MSVEGLGRRGLALVLSSPSGAGKTSIARGLLAKEPELEMSVSVTTRPQRPGEVDGKDYHFIDQAEFDRLVTADALLEHATVFGNSYGSPRAQVEARIDAGRDVLFDIDWQGTQELTGKIKQHLVTVFILPPSADALRQRLTTRAADSPQVIAGRMSKAASELSHFREYDYIVVNRDLDESIAKVRTILVAERQRQERITHLVEFVRGLQDEV
ncbi:MAG TPA: guanylate kinase [Alphaproteobacteria bacterium]|nr:guanylate kinase [Alphaproteobacteria bacterium]